MAFEHFYDSATNLDVVRGSGVALTVRRLGAEVIGLTQNGTEHGNLGFIWRNEQTEDPPRFWKGHAIVLFPIVGGIHNLRSRTTDGTNVHFRKNHGFARQSQFELLGAGGDETRFVLRYHLIDNEETRDMYPWRFELWVRFELTATGLAQEMTVVNRDQRPMPFQLGWHPGFNTPQLSGEKGSCHLRLPSGSARLMLNDANCRLTGAMRDITLAGDFPFTEPALEATYMFDFSNTPREQRVVELLDPDETIGVRVTFPDYPHLGVWSDADAPFICIEPWQGMDDSVEQEPFDRKFGMVLLPPGEQRTYRATIEMLIH